MVLDLCFPFPCSGGCVEVALVYSQDKQKIVTDLVIYQFICW